MGLQIVFMPALDAGDFGLSDPSSPPEATAGIIRVLRGPCRAHRDGTRNVPWPHTLFRGELNAAALSYGA